MKIKEEDFIKLKQLDRIEYRLEEEKLKKEWGGSLFPFLFYLISIFTITLLLVLILSFQILQMSGEESFSNSISVFPKLITGFSILLASLIIMRIIEIYVYHIKRNKLNERFFRKK